MAETLPHESKKIKMYVRVDSDVRRRFKSLAHLSSESMEDRVERVMREDVEKHLPSAAAS